MKQEWVGTVYFYPVTETIHLFVFRSLGFVVVVAVILSMLSFVPFFFLFSFDSLKRAKIREGSLVLQTGN